MKQLINHLVLALASIAVLSCSASALDAPAHHISTAAPGWMWSGMVECDDPSMTDGYGRAGGPGSYGAYTFHGTGVIVYVTSGPSVSVKGRQHKLGNIKVSIDGHESAVAVSHGTQLSYHVAAFETSQLSDAVHVLQIEPDGGWAVVDSVEVLTAAPISDDSGAVDDPKQVGANIPEGDYQIVPKTAGNLCLDVWEKYTSNGTPMQIYMPNQTQRQPNQWFHISPVGGGDYRISPLSAAQEAVTMFNPASDGSLPTGIWDYKADRAQIWRVSIVDGNCCRISPRSDLAVALTVSGEYALNGAAVVCAPWRGLSTQEWLLQNH